MQRNENSTAYTLMKPSSSVTSHTADIKKFLDHWAWEFYTYIFVALFGVFALSCFVVFVREWTQLSPSRNIHGRFTTAQLLIAAMLKVVALLWSPILLKEASRKRFAASLLIDSLSIALTLSAFSILLPHTARNNQDFTGRSEAAKHSGVARYHSRFNSGYAYIQLARFVRREKILALRFIFKPLYLGNINLCRLHCSRLQNVAELKILATTRALYRERKIEKDCNACVFSAFYYRSLVDTEPLPGWQPLRCLARLGNF